jgi:hypothetical protein
MTDSRSDGAARAPKGEKVLEPSTGECRARPPEVHVIHGETITCWPVTAGDDWCAAFDGGDGDD